MLIFLTLFMFEGFARILLFPNALTPNSDLPLAVATILLFANKTAICLGLFTIVVL